MHAVTSLLLAAALGSGPALAAAPRLIPTPDLLLRVAPRPPALDKAQDQLEAGDFEDAVHTLQRALDEPDLSDDQLVELYRMLGLAQLYLGDEAKARDAYEKLLQARPGFELPSSTPPKIRKLYARILEDIRKRRVRPVTLTADAVGEAPGNVPVIVHAQIGDLPLGAKAALHYRRAGAQSFSSVDFARDRSEGSASDAFAATLPAYEVPQEARPYEVEYYVEVMDAAQRRLAGRGDPFSPLTFRVAAKAPLSAAPSAEDTAWYKSPWVWVAGGAVAVGVTAGVVLLVNAKQTRTVTLHITVN